MRLFFEMITGIVICVEALYIPYIIAFAAPANETYNWAATAVSPASKARGEGRGEKI